MKMHRHYFQTACARSPAFIQSHWFGGALALLILLAGMSAHAEEAVGLSEKALRSAISVQQQHEAQLFATPGVLGVGVGALPGTSTPAIHVYINIAAPAASARAMPAHLDGVPVEVI